MDTEARHPAPPALAPPRPPPSAQVRPRRIHDTLRWGRRGSHRSDEEAGRSVERCICRQLSRLGGVMDGHHQLSLRPTVLRALLALALALLAGAVARAVAVAGGGELVPRLRR